MQPSDPFGYVKDWRRKLDTTEGWWHSFELPDGTIINGVCDLPGLRNRLAQFPIPDDLTGKRALDVGAWDGWFSFELERRGAEVVAVDSWDNPRFREIHALTGSRVDYRQMDVYDLTPERIGRFDIVLFMGVLYHLKHPLLALERICSVTTELAAVDSFVLKEEHRPGELVNARPVMEFYETNELGGQADNWVGPSLPCLLAFCRTAGFARAELRSMLEHSACVACYRRWESPPLIPTTPPDLLAAFHGTNFGINFNSAADEYVTCWFDCPLDALSLDDVKPEVSGYGVRPIEVRRAENSRWESGFRLPPGLTPGWHEVRLRIAGSANSNAHLIAVDLPVGKPDLVIHGLRDVATWTSDVIDLRIGNSLAVWVSGLPHNADRENVRVLVDGRRLSVTDLEKPKDTEPRQVNVQVPRSEPAGMRRLQVKVGEGESEWRSLKVVNDLTNQG